MKEVLEKVIEMLKKLVDSLAKPVKKLASAGDSRNKRVLVFAANEIGVKEVKGSGNNKQVVKYHAYARKDNDEKKGLADSVPWCASFVCYCLEKVGMGSTNSMQARSFLKWGVSTKKRALPGDIVVFWRVKRNGWQGHVGFFVKETNAFVYVLGGNQSDSVNVTRYSKSKLLDIRRSSKSKVHSKEEIAELESMADKLISGGKIGTDGKVV